MKVFFLPSAAATTGKRSTNSLFVLLWLALQLKPTFPFAPTLRKTVRSEGTLVALNAIMHRNIFVLSHNVSQNVADGFFDVNNLLTGRVDVLARCVNSALWVSNGIRRDTSVFLMLFPHNITIEIQGEHIRGLNPDERTTALYLQKTLLLGSADSRSRREKAQLISIKEQEQSGRPETVNPHKPGSRSKSEKRELRLARKAREAMLRRIQASDNSTTPPQGFTLHLDDTLEGRLKHLKDHSNGPILMLNEIGEPLWDVMASEEHNYNGNGKKETTLILADQIGYDASDEKLLTENKAVTQVSLGPLSLLTSQCITITHHYIDIDANK